MTTISTFAPQGSVNLVDLRQSISQTRTNFTRLQKNFRRVQNKEPSADFLTLICLICEIYRNYGGELAPVRQIQPNQEIQYSKGHTSAVSHIYIPKVGASNVIKGTDIEQSEVLIVKRPRQSILEEQSYALISFITELRVRTHPPLRKHPNIAQLRGVGWDFEDEEATVPRPLLLEELAPQGALDNFWKKWSFVRMNFKSKLDICQDIAEGLLALHSCGIVHGDVKPENILIFPKASVNNEFMAKLTDFGHSVFEQNRLNALPAFTPQWCAPEATKANNMTFNDMKATDCYSYGLVVLSIMILRPFHIGFEDIEARKHDNTMLPKAIELMEEEDRKNNDSDLEIGVLYSILNHAIQVNSKLRNLKQCMKIIEKYNRNNGHIEYNYQSRRAIAAELLPALKVSEMVTIGYQTLSQTSHQLKEQIASKLLQIASDSKDTRNLACAWELAMCYFSGFGIPASLKDCVHWLSVASKGGVAAAQTFSKSLHAAMKIDYDPPQSIETAHAKSGQFKKQGIVHRTSESPHQGTGLPNCNENDRFLDNESIPDTDDEYYRNHSKVLKLPEAALKLLETEASEDLKDFLAKNPGLLNAQDDDGNTLLLLAAKQQRRDKLEVLLCESGVDAGIHNNAQRTVLHELESYNEAAVRALVPRLVEQKADIHHETLPTRSTDGGITLSFGIRCDSVLNAALHGNLVLLKCLLEACHSDDTRSSCLMCTAGSRFRRTLAISLSIFRADAVEIIVDHVKAHRGSHEIDLSKIEVWAGQELLPLYKVPFNSVAVLAMDLPESLFRAINYGAKYEQMLEQTIQFLLENHKSGRSMAYSILAEAVAKNNFQAIDVIFRESRKQGFPKRWWLQLPIVDSPLFVSIRHGYREAFESFLKEDPLIFSEYIQVLDPKWNGTQSGWRNLAETLFRTRKFQIPEEERKRDINQVQTALNIFVNSLHRDSFFLDAILRTARKDLLTTRPALFFEDAILNSHFAIATVIATRFPEIWSPPNTKYPGGDYPKELGRIVGTLYLPATGPTSQVLASGSYEQCQYVLKSLLPLRRASNNVIKLGRTKKKIWAKEDGVPEWTRCPLSKKEFDYLLKGNISVSRADRHSLWDVIEQQVNLGHSTSATYLRRAISRGDTDALAEMLSRGWNANGSFWVPPGLNIDNGIGVFRSTPWTYCQKLISYDWASGHPLWSFEDASRKLINPDLPQDNWLYSATHAVAYAEYNKQQKAFNISKWTSRLKTCQEILREHSARASPLDLHFSGGGKTIVSWLFIAYAMLYVLVLPLCLVYATGSAWKDVSLGKRFGFAYLWAPPAF